MLKIINRLDDLDIRQLMTVYEESNRVNGARDYKNLPSNLQILYAEQDLYAYLGVFFTDKDSAYAVWAPDGVYKAALRIEPYCDGLIVTGLETAPGERQKGYAAKLVNEVICCLKEKGCRKLYSHVEKTNVASLKLHDKVGFQIISDSATYIDGSFHTDSVTLCFAY